VIIERSRSARSMSSARPSRSVRAVASRERVVEIQRSRLLAGALGAVEELGYPRVTVAHIAGRARVSRRTFYELYGNREDCLLAALESVIEMVRDELAWAGLEGLAWRERVRTGLWMILSFFEREPVLARVVVVQALRGGPRVLERREQVLAGLAGVVDEGRSEGALRGVGCPSLTAEGLVGAAFTIVYGRVLRDDREPLTELLGELMGMIVLPYLGAAAAKRQQAQPTPAVRSHAPRPVLTLSRRGEDGNSSSGSSSSSGGGDLLAGVPMRLTYRTTLVLEAIAQQPGASNRVVAELADISDQGQVSKLLSRLQRLGLIENTGAGHARGERNAWALTHTGKRVAQGIRAHTSQQDEQREAVR
jgi:AcrR family transcriptional regulator/DNA-binding MarR family transcriptional regulator